MIFSFAGKGDRAKARDPAKEYRSYCSEDVTTVTKRRLAGHY
jgi:hypothetical protein